MAAKSRVSVKELEKLVSLVADHPSIFEKCQPDYKDRNIQENIWSSIASVMGREDISAKEWKKKWKSQRDMYVKKRRGMKTSKGGQAAHNRKKWPLMSIMSFLDKFIEPSSTDSNLQEPSAVTDSDNSFNLADEEDTVSVSERSNVASLPQQSEEHEDGPASPTLSTFSASQASTASQHTMRPFTSTTSRDRSRKKVLKGLKAEERLDNALVDLIEIHKRQRTELQAKIMTDKETPKSVAKCFFDSCALRMEKLPEETQSLLQLQIGQLFFNAENPNFPPVSITMNPRRQVCVAPAPPSGSKSK